jgi:hypothetical protein
MMKDETVVVECPICKTLNPQHVSYCVKCGHWLLDTAPDSKIYRLRNLAQFSKTGMGSFIYGQLIIVVFMILYTSLSQMNKMTFGFLYALAGLVSIIVPLKFLRIYNRWAGLVVFLAGGVLFVAGACIRR